MGASPPAGTDTKALIGGGKDHGVVRVIMYELLRSVQSVAASLRSNCLIRSSSIETRFLFSDDREQRVSLPAPSDGTEMSGQLGPALRHPQTDRCRGV